MTTQRYRVILVCFSILIGTMLCAVILAAISYDLKRQSMYEACKDRGGVVVQNMDRSNPRCVKPPVEI